MDLQYQQMPELSGVYLAYAFLRPEVTSDAEAPHIKAVLGEISVTRNDF